MVKPISSDMDRYDAMKSYIDSIDSPLIEVRVIKRLKPGKDRAEILSGWFNDSDKLAACVKKIDDDSTIGGIYNTVHRIDEGKIHENGNKPINRLERSKSATRNDQVSHYTRLLIDVDAERPEEYKKQPATADELELALQEIAKISNIFDELNIPMQKAMSGNGYHIHVYHTPLENTPENTRRYKAIGQRFKEHGYKVDTSVLCSGQIFKLYNTQTRKGNHTDERPHRRSVLYANDAIEPIPFDDLEKLIYSALPDKNVLPASNPKPKTNTKNNGNYNGPKMTLGAWLDKYGIKHKGALPWSHEGTTGTKYQLDNCPFNPEHDGTDSYVFEPDDNSGWGFKCSHDSCAGHNTWEQFRAKAAPNAPKKQVGNNKNESAQPSKELTVEAVEQWLETGKIEKCRHSELPVVYDKSIILDSNGRPYDDNRTAKAIAEEAWKNYLNHDNYDTPLYNSGGIPVAVAHNATGKVEIIAKDTTSDIIALLAEKSAFYTIRRRVVNTQTYLRSEPLRKTEVGVANHLFANNAFFDLPQLDAVMDHVFFNKDWQFINENGYDPVSRLFLHQGNKFTYTENADMVEASAKLSNLYQDFPYTDRLSCMATVLAEIITLLIHPALSENPPIFVTRSPDPQTGKTYEIATTLAIVKGTHDISGLKTASLPQTEDEMEKTLFSFVKKGRTAVVFDNADNHIESNVLSRYATSPSVEGRLLHTNSVPEYPNNLIIFLNGNNTTFDTALNTRCVFKTMHATEKPENREFKYDSPPHEAIAIRDEILSPVIYMIKKWIENGKEISKTHSHRKREWAGIVGGILNTCGLGEYFLVNAEYDSIQGDPVKENWLTFCEIVYKEKGTREWASDDVFEAASFKDIVPSDKDDNRPPEPEGRRILDEYINGFKEQQRKTSFGKLLRDNMNKTFGDYRLIRTETRKRNRWHYKIEKLSG